MIELIPDCLLSLERRTRFTEEQSIGRFLLPRETCQVVPKHAQGVCLARQETIVLKPGQGFLCQLPTGKKVALPILKPRQRNLTMGCKVRRDRWLGFASKRLLHPPSPFA